MGKFLNSPQFDLSYPVVVTANAYALMNASRSALMTSACVVIMPCG